MSKQLLILALTSALQAQLIELITEVAGGAHLVYLVAPETFEDEDQLDRTCRDLLDAHREKRFFQAVLFVSRLQATSVDYRGHRTYESWFKYQEWARTQDWKVAVLTLVDGQAVLRSRNGDRIDRRLLLGKQDPLMLNAGGDRVELLWITPGRSEFFARTTGEPRTEAATQLHGELKRAFKGNLLHLKVRQDSWFIWDDEHFPLYYWFDRSPTPSKRQTDEAPQVHCMDPGKGLKCWKIGPRIQKK